MKYLSKVLIFFLCLIVGWVCFLMLKSYFQQPEIMDHGKLAISLGQKNLDVEVVNSKLSITQGLSGRDQIGSDGMLFFLPSTTVPTFWMKDMKFDLDLIWIKNFQVVDITKNASRPDPQTPLSQLPIYSPQTPANMVLEVEAGRADIWGIKIGDKLTFH